MIKVYGLNHLMNSLGKIILIIIKVIKTSINIANNYYNRGGDYTEGGPWQFRFYVP